MSEIIIETEILKKVEKLYNEVYFLYCKLDRYRDKIESQAAVKFMSNNLYLLCREEFRRIYEPYEIEYDKEKYTHKKRRGKHVPRETWFLHRKNLSAKYFIDGVAEEANGFFAAFKKKLAERKYNRPVRRFFRRLFKRGHALKSNNVVTDRGQTTVSDNMANVLSELAAAPNEPPAPQKQAKQTEKRTAETPICIVPLNSQSKIRVVVDDKISVPAAAKVKSMAKKLKDEAAAKKENL